MIVRMRADIQGTRNGREWPPRGGTIDLPDGEAQQMIEQGYAEDAARPPDKPEPLRYAHEHWNAPDSARGEVM